MSAVSNPWGNLTTLGKVVLPLLAVIIVAFTAYSLIARKKRELAIAKALGFGNGQIYLAALYQTLAITLLGLVFAVMISFTIFEYSVNRSKSPLMTNASGHRCNANLVGIAACTPYLLAS